MVNILYLSVFFILGFFSNIIQAIFFKEFMTTYFGNELLLGILLFIFFISFSAGAYLYKNFSSTVKKYFFIFILLSAALGAIAVQNLNIIRELRAIALVKPYLLFQLKSILYYTFLVVFPSALILGFLFAGAVDLYSDLKSKKSGLKFYFSWGAGFFVSGVLFTFVLSKFFNHVELILSIIAILSLTLFLITIADKKGIINIIFSTVITAAFIGSLFFSGKIEEYTFFKRWNIIAKNDTLVVKKESNNENILIGKQSDIYNIYLNGREKISFPDIFSESVLANLIMIQHKNPKDILVIGIPSADFINELLLYDTNSIDFLSPDPEVNELVRNELKIQKNNVAVINEDPIFFLKKSFKKYDLVIYRSLDPDTLLLNRLFTKETFMEVKKRLNKSALFVTSIAGDYYYIDNESLLFNKTHLNTLNKVFKNCNIIPGDNIYYFASDDQDNFSSSLDEIEKRYLERKTKSASFEIDFFVEILRKNKAEDYKIKLQNYEQKLINKFSNPVFNYSSSFLYYKDSGKTIHIIPEFLLKGYAKAVIIISVLLLFVVLFLFNKNIPLSIVSSNGFTGFSLFMILALSFQTSTGVLYGFFALINGIFMLGFSFAALTAEKIKIYKKEVNIKMLTLFLLIIFFTAVNLFIIYGVKSFTVTIIIYSIMLFLAGFASSFGMICSGPIETEKEVAEKSIYSSVFYFLSAGIGALLWGISFFAVLGAGLNLLMCALIIILLMVYLAYKK